LDLVDPLVRICLRLDEVNFTVDPVNESGSEQVDGMNYRVVCSAGSANRVVFQETATSR
jgi:hypothetical protein